MRYSLIRSPGGKSARPPMQARDDGTYLFSPTDLVNFLGCSHSTVLDIRAFAEQLEEAEPSENDKLLRRMGDEHEAAYLKRLKEDGKTVTEIPKKRSNAERSRLTREAMR